MLPALPVGWRGRNSRPIPHPLNAQDASAIAPSSYSRSDSHLENSAPVYVGYKQRAGSFSALIILQGGPIKTVLF